MRYQRTTGSILMIALLLLPGFVRAAMQSDHYVIYENVMHNFDGPVITGVSCTSGGANAIAVAWTTDVTADHFVIYSTDSALAGAKEQGSAVKSGTAHSVTVTGLSGNTTYYYRVRSTRINGGITTDPNIRTCTSGAGVETPGPTPTGGTGGGGILIIDKTDKDAPKISVPTAAAIDQNSVTFTWETDEPATSFVEYGLTESYGRIAGDWSSSTAHRVTVDPLNTDTDYHFRIISSDGWGNIGRSGDLTARTEPGGLEIIEPEEIVPGQPPVTPEATGTPDSIIGAASERLLQLLNQYASQISLNFFETTATNQLQAIQQLSDFVPAPILSGEPRVTIETDSATIYWTTDKPANSLVAVAPEGRYAPSAAEPYLQIVGQSDALTQDHEVRIFGLQADTVYHYQLRSKPLVGPTGTSRDFTFRTKLDALAITSFFYQLVDQETAVFKWVTNKESDSAVTFAPYRDGQLAVAETKTVRDTAQTVIHEIRIGDFSEGVTYQIELQSRDTDNNQATENITQFSTSPDDNPPVISHIQTDSTIFIDRGNKIQTIISWRTSEPSTSRVYYQEGVVATGDLRDSTATSSDYAKEHVVVITKFQSGLVYSFRVESIDSGGNKSISDIHTFMTPKKKESIFQIIIRILEETFGWIKKIG